jgi:hypothetical protein
MFPRKASDFGNNKMKLDFEHPEAIIESSDYEYISEDVLLTKYLHSYPILILSKLMGFSKNRMSNIREGEPSINLLRTIEV